jgi:hypothetical protein
MLCRSKDCSEVLDLTQLAILGFGRAVFYLLIVDCFALTERKTINRYDQQYFATAGKTAAEQGIA